MKIAHLSISALPANVGGLEIVVDNLIRHQRAAGHDAQLITRWKQAKACRQADIDYPFLALPPNPKLSAEPFADIGPRLPVEIALAWHQIRHRFDLFHVHFLYPTGWLAHRALKRLKVPMIVTAHGADLNVDRASNYGYRQYEIHDARLRAIAPELPSVTAISGTMRAALSNLGIDEHKIHRVDNGVDFARFEDGGRRANGIRQKLDVPGNAALILSVGRNQPSKGYDSIPQVLTELNATGRKVIWAIVGKGSENLKPQFESAGLGENVRLLQPTQFSDGINFPSNGLIDLYRAADVFAFPSLSEGAPLVALEAMAAGIPVAGNDVRGISDTIEHEISGLLVPPRDANAMAAAIDRLLGDIGIRQQCITGGLAKAKQHDWANIAAQYIGLYGELTGPDLP